MAAITLTSSSAATADALLSKRAAEIDELYRAAAPGPLPSGPTRGTALALTGRRAGRVFARLVRVVGWQGKTFAADGCELDNSITALRLHAIKAQVYVGKSWLDDRDTIVIDYSKTSWVARFVRDEIREISPGLYLGIVFVGRRRLPLRFALATM